MRPGAGKYEIRTGKQASEACSRSTKLLTRHANRLHWTCHERTRMEIKRIQTERVKRTETGNRTMSGNPTANKALVPATTINATTSTDATSTAQ
jgi:hypothetical protein